MKMRRSRTSRRRPVRLVVRRSSFVALDCLRAGCPTSLRAFHFVSPGGSMRARSLGHVFFAATLVAFGIMGLVTTDFTQIWLPVPAWVPARVVVACLVALVALACGVGILLPHASKLSSRVL